MQDHPVLGQVALGYSPMIEQESLLDIRAQAEVLLPSLITVNRAVLTALRSARQLDG